MWDRETAVFISRLTVSSFQSLSGIMRHTGDLSSVIPSTGERLKNYDADRVRPLCLLGWIESRTIFRFGMYTYTPNQKVLLKET